MELRTHKCGELRQSDEGKHVKLCGPLYFLSGFLDHYYHHAGDLLLLCEKKDLRTGS